MKRAFTLVEAICVVLLLSCVAVGMLSLTETFTNSMAIAQDVMTSHIAQRKFDIALGRMLVETKFTACIYKGDIVNNAFPRINTDDSQVAISDIHALRVLRNELFESSADLIYAFNPPWAESSANSISPITFVLFREAPYYDGTGNNSENNSKLIVGKLSVYTETLNEDTKYATVSLKTANDELIASYSIRLSDSADPYYFQKTAAYAPHVGCYTLALPSNSSFCASAAKSQVNIFRYGFFNPDVLILP